MKTFQRFLICLSAFAVLAVALQLAEPKAVHAMVAALVRDVDNPARATLVSASCSADSDVSGNFFCSPYTVPAGQRLVIEQVEASCQIPAGAAFVQSSLSVSSANPFVPDIVHPLGMTSLTPGLAAYGSVHYEFSRPVRYYAESGAPLSFFAETIPAGGTCTFQLNGYLISYP